MVEEAVVMIIITVIENAVEIKIEKGTTTAAMRAIVNQVTDFSMRTHVMEDAEILTALHQMQTIETVGIPTMSTSTVITIKITLTMIQVTAQNTVACKCHGNNNSVTVIIAVLIFQNTTSKEIWRQ